MSDPELARYQAALMAVLARTDIDVAERMRLLHDDPACRPYAGYVETFDPDLVALGANILEAWGRPDPAAKG
jgi:hypothetical protein